MRDKLAYPTVCVYDSRPFASEKALFIAGKDGYHTYRIPALAVTTRGTVLAFCEGRKHSSSDAGNIDIVLRRSHDHGLTWTEPEVIIADGDMTCGNPCPVVDASDGTIWLPFCKNLGEGHERVVTRSSDGGLTFAPPEWDTTLVEPVCQAGLVRFTHAATHGRDRILFSNPASAAKRERMTIRLSYDEGRTWPLFRILHAGPAAYSDLATAQDEKTILCLYERGISHPYETITCAAFDLKWLSGGQDAL
ncbi:MAG: hypothetical protein A3K19_23385 [Lentisphaerae bacterium RIFOXYB12_FULL_65_16]|nr:MAG: hypothetical protein A3K18_26340 [Lentisphaerae bacterium RIFOXYA12_64_32]OGV87508.1 MAG: hypothetical protein A3K19_23385 [Lentisphaerae bacterium RIFOXYB12_FULL_65_16]